MILGLKGTLGSPLSDLVHEIDCMCVMIRGDGSLWQCTVLLVLLTFSNVFSFGRRCTAWGAGPWQDHYLASPTESCLG